MLFNFINVILFAQSPNSFLVSKKVRGCLVEMYLISSSLKKPLQ